MRRSGGDPQRVPAEAQRDGVCQVVAGVGQKREAAAQPPCESFHDDERQREPNRGGHSPARHVRSNVRVAVWVVTSVIVRVVCHGWLPPRSRQSSRRVPLRTTSPTEKRSEEHTSELQSLRHLVCRLLLEKKKRQ